MACAVRAQQMKKARSQNGFTLIETLLVVALIGVISVMAVPMMSNLIGNFRVTGDARTLSNSMAVAKMRAAANFTRVRIYADLTGQNYRMETWDKTAATWVTEAGATYLSSGVDFGYDIVPTPPPNTTGIIDQPAKCTTDEGDEIDGTACIMFNSRGVPIDTTSAPIVGAMYITDGEAVYAVSVASTGMMKSWQTYARSVPNWVMH